MRHRLVIVLSALAVLAGAWPASAQTYSVQKPRRQFITVSYDWLYTQPLHFGEHPVEDLVGQEVSAAQFEDFDYPSATARSSSTCSSSSGGATGPA